MHGWQPQPAAQEPADRERDAGDAEERRKQRGEQHDRNDRQEQKREAQQRDRRQGQQDHHEARTEGDLCAVPVLEAFDRRQESLARRLEGLMALRDRLEAVSAEVRGVRETLAAGAPPPPVAAAAVRAADDSGYAAFETRFRGRSEDLRERLASYVVLFEGLAPVADLGCGRGEFVKTRDISHFLGLSSEKNTLQLEE